MKRETFVQIISALLAEADDELIREAEGLLFWRKRELRSQRVKRLAPLVGVEIFYFAKDGKTKQRATLAKLNKYSVSVKRPHAERGYIVEVVPVERVITVSVIE